MHQGGAGAAEEEEGGEFPGEIADKVPQTDGGAIDDPDQQL